MIPRFLVLDQVQIAVAFHAIIYQNITGYYFILARPKTFLKHINSQTTFDTSIQQKNT
jgi:hypothetical protein